MRTQFIVAAALLMAAPAAAEKQRSQAVAVFPFKVLNKDPRAAHFGEGAAEHIITHLVRSNAVEIVEAAQLDKAIKGLAKQQTGAFDESYALELGRLVNARYVVIGTVQAFGMKVAINARLLEVETGKLVIAESIHGKVTDIFSLYEELAERLKNSLVNHLSMLVTSGAVAESGGQVADVSILELLKRGEADDPAFGGRDVKAANMAYRQAVLRDPGHAEARRRLGTTFIAMQRYDEAAFNLKKSLENDDRSSKAHASYGYCLHRLGDEGGAVVHYQKAIELDPKNLEARAWLAASLLKLGQVDEARAHLTYVLDRDPKNDLALRGMRFVEQAQRQAKK